MLSKTYKPSRQTRTRILEKAVELFNEHGTSGISLNALAVALDMSTGNLQYHYRSKEQIIREIYEFMFLEFEPNFAGMDGSFGIETLRTILQKNFDLIWKYRFFYREYATLLRNDPQLSERFKAVQEKRISQQESLIRLLAHHGRFRSQPDEKEIRNIALTGWVLGNTWLSYLESTGVTIDQAALEEAVDMLIMHYKPYLSDSWNS
jgi:AcrR family transcriptional regulator